MTVFLCFGFFYLTSAGPTLHGALAVSRGNTLAFRWWQILGLPLDPLVKTITITITLLGKSSPWPPFCHPPSTITPTYWMGASKQTKRNDDGGVPSRSTSVAVGGNSDNISKQFPIPMRPRKCTSPIRRLFGKQPKQFITFRQIQQPEWGVIPRIGTTERALHRFLSPAPSSSSSSPSSSDRNSILCQGTKDLIHRLASIESMGRKSGS